MAILLKTKNQRHEKSTLTISILYYYFYLLPRKLLLHLLNITPKKQIFVLLYHSVEDVNHENKLGLNVLPTIFEEQMRYLLESPRSKIISLHEFEKLTNNKPNIDIDVDVDKYYFITFDDGLRNFLTGAMPILHKYNLPAILFAICKPYISSHDKDHYEDGSGLPLLNKQQLMKILKHPNIKVASHSLSHQHNLCDLSKDRIVEDLKKSKEILEAISGNPINYYSCPHGKYNRKLIGIARQIGYKKVFTSDCDSNTVGRDEFLVKRVEISGFDNLFKFKLKVNGAYNWKRFLKVLKIIF
ncbi:MAG: polysaccharide deacetylase family protein [Oligoflexia bacterium]|nr:polysaccharide deacetylase family protein [Oligoflexia bacterium]